MRIYNEINDNDFEYIPHGLTFIYDIKHLIKIFGKKNIMEHYGKP